jgi:hypothetical protein
MSWHHVHQSETCDESPKDGRWLTKQTSVRPSAVSWILRPEVEGRQPFAQALNGTLLELSGYKYIMQAEPDGLDIR